MIDRGRGLSGLAPTIGGIGASVVVGVLATLGPLPVAVVGTGMLLMALVIATPAMFLVSGIVTLLDVPDLSVHGAKLPVFALVALALAIRMAVRGERVRLSRPLALFAVLAGVSETVPLAVGTPHLLPAIETLLLMWGALAFAGWIESNVGFNRLDQALLWPLILSMLIAFALYRAQVPIPETYLVSGHLIYRAGGPFYEANGFGVLCALGFVWALDKALQRISVVHLLVMGLTGYMLTRTFSRDSMVALVVGAILVFAAYAVQKRQKGRLWLGLGLSLGLIVLLIWSQRGALGARLTQSLSATSLSALTSGRVADWRWLVSMLPTWRWFQWLFGLGYKNATAGLLYFYGKPWVADNQYMDVFVEMGLPGLACLFWWLSRAGRDVAKQVRTHPLPAAWLMMFGVNMLALDTFTVWRVLPLVVAGTLVEAT